MCQSRTNIIINLYEDNNYKDCSISIYQAICFFIPVYRSCGKWGCTGKNGAGTGHQLNL